MTEAIQHVDIEHKKKLEAYRQISNGGWIGFEVFDEEGNQAHLLALLPHEEPAPEHMEEAVSIAFIREKTVVGEWWPINKKEAQRRLAELEEQDGDSS